MQFIIRLFYEVPRLKNLWLGEFTKINCNKKQMGFLSCILNLIFENLFNFYFCLSFRYEMLAQSQRDLTAEQAAEKLRNLPDIHYSAKS